MRNLHNPDSSFILTNCVLIGVVVRTRLPEVLFVVSSFCLIPFYELELVSNVLVLCEFRLVILE